MASESDQISEDRVKGELRLFVTQARELWQTDWMRPRVSQLKPFELQKWRETRISNSTGLTDIPGLYFAFLLELWRMTHIEFRRVHTKK